MIEKYRQKYSHAMKFEENIPGVLEIIFSGPNLNAVDEKLHEDIPEIWRDIDRDPAVRVALVRGEGKAFSAGGDFALIEAQYRDYHIRHKVLRESRDLFYNMINCNKPIISAIHGAAVGAGLVVALMADISIAAKNAKIVDGHTRLGIAAGDHAAMVWPLLCGMAKAKYLLFTCEKITGQEADDLGLVSMSVEEADLLPKAREIARKLSFGAQESIAFTKHSMNMWYRQNSGIFETSLGYDFLGVSGPDVLEGVNSHREKRPPVFVKEG
jgi:enoyl-CoA hydratase